MSGPDFHTPQSRFLRRRKPTRSCRGIRSNQWLTPVMAIAFAAALAGFQRFPGEAIADVPVAPEMPFLHSAASAAPDALSARFGLCHSGGRRDCVVDGDSFRFAGETYRIADIDTPETHPARCAEEAALGNAATDRLQQWLNRGAFSLEVTGRDTDRYGRKLRIVTRGGTSVGSVLVDEGLARPWGGARRPWC